jgi:hypothetical protein
MDTEPLQPDLQIVRDLLVKACSPPDLRRLCLDHPLLRSIVERFGPDLGLDDRIEMLDYCGHQARLSRRLFAQA